MKGNCELIKCQICQEEMSFGRIQRHIKTKHENIGYQNYVNTFWQTLPLHQPCIVCKNSIVYKYKTCSKECRNKLEHKHKGVKKPEGFMDKEHKSKISKSHNGKIVSKETGEKISKSSLGVSRNKGKTPMLGKSQSNYQKEQVRKRFNKFYADGNKPWTKLNNHTPETIEKIMKSGLSKNKLEMYFSKLLKDNNIKHTYSYFLKDEKICKQFDFKLKDSNILIEVDGDYWHGNPQTKSHFKKVKEVQENDLFKEYFAKSQGFKLLRFWEKDINENPNLIINQIKELL